MPGKYISKAAPLSPDEGTLRDELRAAVQMLAGEIGERNMWRYAQLNAAANGNFAAATIAERTSIVSVIAGKPFFEKVRSTCITSLYNNELAFKHFGYEGAVWTRGGYIKHGFSDLAWLPNPPEVASPNGGGSPSFTLRHSITVTDYTVRVWRGAAPSSVDGKWIPLERLRQVALTGLARKILQKAEML